LFSCSGCTVARQLWLCPRTINDGIWEMRARLVVCTAGVTTDTGSDAALEPG